MVDSLKAYEILKTSALPEPQARAILTVIGSVIEENNLHQAKDLAAKEDLANFEAKARAMESSLKQDMAGLRGDLSRMERMLVEAKGGLETKISDTKSELLRWMFVFWIGQVGAMIAIMFTAIRLLK